MNDRSDTPAAPAPTRSRSQIIAVSHRLFLLQGFHGTTMRQIAKHAGVALGSLYNHFADKDDLFSAVFEAYNPYPTLLLRWKTRAARTPKNWCAQPPDAWSTCWQPGLTW